MSGRPGVSRRVTPYSILLLAACAPSPAPVPTVPRAAPAPASAPVHVPRAHPSSASELPLEQRERERAEALMQEGRWADAATHWEILQLLRRDQQEYTKKLAEARAQSSHAAAEHLQEAEQARSEGQASRAIMLYLKALSADPGNTEAAQALRDIEKERARKSNLGPSARGANGEAALAALSTRRSSKPSATPSTAEGRELDSAILLLHQGDYSAGVQTLEIYLRKNPHDDLARRTLQDAYVELARQRSQEGKKEEALTYLEKAQAMRDGKSSPALARSIQSLRKEIAEDYYQQGLRAQRADLSEAISSWETALKYDPDHPQAAQRLERARRMEQNLRSIPGPDAKP